MAILVLGSLYILEMWGISQELHGMRPHSGKSHEYCGLRVPVDEAIQLLHHIASSRNLTHRVLTSSLGARFSLQG